MLETPKDLYTLVIIRNIVTISSIIAKDNQQETKFLYKLDINKVGSSETTCETLIFYSVFPPPRPSTQLCC
jgi:hypothetical protein